MAETRLLIFGGTFDPPHRAHTLLPPMAAEALGCEHILYIPAGVNPLKADEEAAPALHRLAMLRLALEGVAGTEISTLELDRPGPSYSVDTLRVLHERRGDEAELVLLIGSDQALQFQRWKDWPEILKLARPAVMVRAPLDEQTYRGKLLSAYSRQQAERWLTWTVDVPQLDISASEVRKRLTEGGDVDDLLDPAVIDYMRNHGLYGLSNTPQL